MTESAAATTHDGAGGSATGGRRAPTLPKNGVKIVFSDLDGTLVHYEKHFSPHGRIVTTDATTAAGGAAAPATATALYRNEQAGSPRRGETRACALLPTLTMGPGLFSRRSAELVARLRAEGVIFVYVSGARKSTMLKRLPLLAPADYAVAETGGRMYRLVDDEGGGGGGGGQAPVLDEEWTRDMEALCGSLRDGGPPPEERAGALWDWYRELRARGVPCDARDYTCCFRVDCTKTPGSDALVAEALGALPPGVSCAQNLGKYDFFPATSGKWNAARYLLDALGLARDDAVALFDDENDLPMAEACGHGCVLRCTHARLREHLPRNPHWHLATETGVFATEEMLGLLLENATSAKRKATPEPNKGKSPAN